MNNKACALPKLSQYFSDCLYFTSGSLFRKIDRMAAEAFRDSGLSPSHGFLLMALDETDNEYVTPSQLAEVMSLESSTVTRLVQRLEKDGLASRCRKGKHTRVSITDEGRLKLPAIHDAWKRLYESYCDYFGKEEAVALNQCIAEGIGTHSPQSE